MDFYIDKQLKVYIKKNSDYGNSFYESLDEFGRVAFLVRARDKINRLKTLMVNTRSVKNESIEDTVNDLFNYTAMYHSYIKSKKYKSELDITTVLYSMRTIYEIGLEKLLFMEELLEVGCPVYNFIEKYYK